MMASCSDLCVLVCVPVEALLMVAQASHASAKVAAVATKQQVMCVLPCNMEVGRDLDVILGAHADIGDKRRALVLKHVCNGTCKVACAIVPSNNLAIKVCRCCEHECSL